MRDCRRADGNDPLSNRPAPLSREQQADLGQAVAHLRARGVCWKEIERQLQMERTQLWRCLKALEMQQQKPGMQQQKPGMQHLGDCQAA